MTLKDLKYYDTILKNSFPLVMEEKYAKFNLGKLRDDFPSLKDRINLRLTPPNEDKYFTTLLNVI